MWYSKHNNGDSDLTFICQIWRLVWVGGAYTVVRGEVVVVRRLGGGDHTPVASGAQLETEPEPGLGTHCLQTVITHTGDCGGSLLFVIPSISFVRVRRASKSSVFPCFQPQSPCPVWASQLTVTQWCHRSFVALVSPGSVTTQHTAAPPWRTSSPSTHQQAPRHRPTGDPGQVTL